MVVSHQPTLAAEDGTISGPCYVDILKLDIKGADRKVYPRQPPRWLNGIGVIASDLHDRAAPASAKSFCQATCEPDSTS